MQPPPQLVPLEEIQNAFEQVCPVYCSILSMKSGYFQIEVGGWERAGSNIHYEFRQLTSSIRAEFHIEYWTGLNDQIQALARRVGIVAGYPIEFSHWMHGCRMGVSFPADVSASQMTDVMVQFIEATHPEIDRCFQNEMARQAGLPGVMSGTEEKEDSMTKPLNQILYGPPGTGKTYETIYAALQILDPASAAAYKQVVEDDEASQDERFAARAKLKASFDKLSNEQRVRFVTFHQSFSYEDFVEGLRAETDDATGQIHYEVVDGIFKAICSDAKSGGRLVSVFDQAMERLQEKLEASNGRLALKTVRGNAFEVAYDGGKTFRVFPKSTEVEDPYYVASIENVRKLFAGEPKKGMYNTSYVEGMLRYLQAECGLPATLDATEPSAEEKTYVLIIDEINRGNISRIFGELITLIEQSKRAGADEALSVTLPYSKARFSVPDNVYIIGTMNTADRSLAGLDLALRRRFSFTEMPPRPDLLDAVVVGGVNIGQMLRVMNQRITVLLDRDHTIGHAYFMPLQTAPTLAGLADIFCQKILPLLQEYFFEDWERIRWVLNDQTKPDGVAFIIEDKSLDVSSLFSGVADKLRQSPQWVLNPEAFNNPAAYRGIAANLGQVAAVQSAAEEADA